MLHLLSLREGLPLFRALGSDIRVRILEAIARQGPMQMSAIASAVGITDGALTPHVKMLAKCGIIAIEAISGAHGVQKVCRIKEDRILVEALSAADRNSVYVSEIGVGQYTAYEVYPTCGLATSKRLVGELDDPRHFASPDRMQASILWLGHGYVEYMLPNFLSASQELTEIQISMELSSEAPGSAEDWPSDIYFHINGHTLGYWTSPGDFGAVRGIYNPSWWNSDWNQYGMYKLLSVNQTGTFIDGMKISDVRIGELGVGNNANITFRLSVPETAENVGGMTLFGRSFGNYHQDIKVRMHYRDKEYQRKRG